MQRIDFFRLERAVQERFIASAQGAAQPFPLAIERARTPRAVWVWTGAAALSLMALLALSSVGYGALDSRLALHPPTLIGAYALIAAAAAFCTLRVRAELSARRALPYEPGQYIFPSGLIDARDREFVVRPLSTLSKTAVTDRSLSLEFNDQSRFSFRLQTTQHAQEVERALTEYRERSKAAPLAANARELALLDPLCDNGFRNPFSPIESMRPPASKRFSFRTLAAVAAGAALGLGVFAFRNAIAERALYARARAHDTRAAYLAYLARGGTRSEVREVLLPQAELGDVVSGGSLEALESFARSSKSSKISSQVDAALRDALSRELEQARRKGTFDALRDFRAKHGKHTSIAPAVERAIQEHWQAHLKTFYRTARPTPRVKDFFRRLLAYTSQHGSRVDLRFRRRLAVSVPRAEALIRKSQYFVGEESLPAQYFDSARSLVREEPVARQITAALRPTFPSDLLDFQFAPPLQDSEAELPPVSVPTLLITHRTEMSGGYLLRRPRAALTGIGVLFSVTFQIPGDKEALHFKLSTWNVPDLKRAEDFKGFADIYDEMGSRAFAKLPNKFLADLVPGLKV